uniref:DUF6530 family protein n=1 Tax=Flavobacterium sp. TaxID=239 RepID=UPI004048A0AD
MKTPTHLAHKPIITVDNYNLIDGNHAGFDSDAKALSLGFASYDKQEYFQTPFFLLFFISPSLE